MSQQKENLIYIGRKQTHSRLTPERTAHGVSCKKTACMVSFVLQRSGIEGGTVTIRRKKMHVFADALPGRHTADACGPEKGAYIT